MGQVLFIVWRESVEAMLVIGILHAWLSQNPAAGGKRWLWGGVLAGLLPAAGGEVLLEGTPDQPDAVWAHTWRWYDAAGRNTRGHASSDSSAAVTPSTGSPNAATSCHDPAAFSPSACARCHSGRLPIVVSHSATGHTRCRVARREA